MASKRTSERFGGEGIGAVQLRSYGVAILSVALALGITLLLRAWLYPTTTPLFFVAVMVSAWYGGWKAGFLATVLSTLGINYFFIEPLHSLQILNLETVVRLSTFLMAAGLISSLNHSRRRALQNARKNVQSLQAAMSREQAVLAEAKTASERMETVLTSINDGFYTLDRNWRFTYVNDRYCEMVQMQPFELLGQTVWELFPAAVDTEAYVQFHQAMAEQTPRQFDYLYAPWNRWHDHRIYPSPSGLTVLISDITDRKQAEEELRQNRDRLAFVLRTTEIGLWLNSLPLGSLNWDDRTRELFFVPPGVEPTIELFWSRVHPEDREPTRLAVEEALRDRTLYEIDHRAVNPDTGEIRWIRSAGKATYALDGTPIRFDGVNYDISDRKWAELNDQFLNQLDARLRQLSDADAMAWDVVSSLGRYLNVDRSVWNEIDAAANLAIVQQDWYQHNDMPGVVGVYQLSNFALPSLINLYHAGQTVVVADVTTHPCTLSFVDNYIPYDTYAYVAVPCVAEGKWVALLSVNTRTPRHWRSDEVALLQEVVARLWSLIEHTRAVQDLRDSEAEFRQLANAMPQIVYVFNANGVLEFVNDRWTDYTGLTLEQSRDQALMRQVIPLEDYEQIQSDFVLAQEARSPYQSQFRLIQSDGSYLYFLTRAIPLLDQQGQIRRWYGTSTDITGLKQLEAELRQKTPF
ncbi:MAG: PAS domain S-box protein [Cyanobacteria bacterium CRU_2_1]|nr:PAS domain S-box protein [Cyanobacteria bacterium CRU_2_1]